MHECTFLPPPRFWQMVWEQDIHLIVMMTNEVCNIDCSQLTAPHTSS